MPRTLSPCLFIFQDMNFFLIYDHVWDKTFLIFCPSLELSITYIAILIITNQNNKNISGVFEHDSKLTYGARWWLFIINLTEIIVFLSNCISLIGNLSKRLWMFWRSCNLYLKLTKFHRGTVLQVRGPESERRNAVSSSDTSFVFLVFM